MNNEFNLEDNIEIKDSADIRKLLKLYRDRFRDRLDNPETEFLMEDVYMEKVTNRLSENWKAVEKYILEEVNKYNIPFECQRFDCDQGKSKGVIRGNITLCGNIVGIKKIKCLDHQIDYAKKERNGAHSIDIAFMLEYDDGKAINIQIREREGDPEGVT